MTEYVTLTLNDKVKEIKEKENGELYVREISVENHRSTTR